VADRANVEGVPPNTAERENNDAGERRFHLAGHVCLFRRYFAWIERI